MQSRSAYLILAICLTKYGKAQDKIKIFDTRIKPKLVQSCDSLVFCQGQLLETVQLAKLHVDSKTFVDMSQIHPSNTTLKRFQEFLRQNENPTKWAIKRFVKDNFDTEWGVEKWVPQDYVSTPEFVTRIDDVIVKHFSKTLVSIWPRLARRVKKDVSLNPDRYSLISVPNGFIVPGGRFKEMYYWDSYWIIKALLLCEMRQTARGILDNFLFLVRKFGFVPNATRLYYLNRSQPPLLTATAGVYMDVTNDTDWLRDNIRTLEEELLWWIRKKTVIMERDGINYTIARFTSDSGTPRPESYYEDFHTCLGYTKRAEKEICYKNLKSAAESGWDFSSRWIISSEGDIDSNLSHIETDFVAPVDLNSFLCKGSKELSRFYHLLGDEKKSAEWSERFSLWKRTLEDIFYDKTDGIWYDYDITLARPRKYFYLSNFAPLWSDCYDTSLRKEYGSKAIRYYREQKLDKHEGGVPVSIISSGEQWDWPNVWPPLQEILVTGFRKTGGPEGYRLAEEIARKWIKAVHTSYDQNGEIYEKYDATVLGQYGGGGEYVVQVGFGWTNAVTLLLMDEFYANNSKR